MNLNIFAKSLTLLIPLFFSCCASIPEIEKKSEILEDTEEKFVYKNTRDEIIDYELKPGVARCQYDKSLFTIENMKAAYTGDPNYTYRWGIDVSRHEKRINWKKVKKAGVEFAFLRIGWRGYQSGILHVDERFHRNIKNARKQGIDIGVYVFSQALNEEEAIEEADLVINELQGYEIQLPVVYDPESIPWEEARTDQITGEQVTKNTIAFCNRIKEAGYEPMIYSNLRWETSFFDLTQLKEYKIWFAYYNTPPLTPYHFEFWQYSGEGVKVPGIRRKCDGDIQLIPVTKNEE